MSKVIVENFTMSAIMSTAPLTFQSFTTKKSSYVIPDMYDLGIDDTIWILINSFIIFTMQTGFGMLESGCVSVKNEVNIMMKNIVDAILGGITYWLFGYGMSFGRSEYTNPFIGLGDFLIDPSVDDPLMGRIFTSFMFQLSFSTTATTIVSGSMAERCNFKAYALFSFINTVVYCVPAGWVWGDHGFLKNLGAVDIAGSGPVHLVGGTSAFVSAAMLGPRLGRYTNGRDPLPMGNPVNACVGLFILWWGWMAFNAGSTYGVANGKWLYTARAAVMTMMASFGGGFYASIFTVIKNRGRADVLDLINGVLAALVSVTAGCYLYRVWEALLVGIIGAVLVSFLGPLWDRIGVDDPVGASIVHGLGGVWGVIAVGLFADNPKPLTLTNGRSGLFKGGGWSLLGIQCTTAICLICWSAISTFVLLWLVNKIIPIRMGATEELLGADLTEHNVNHNSIGISRALSALAPVKVEFREMLKIPKMGRNPGHESTIDEIKNADNDWSAYDENSAKQSIQKKQKYQTSYVIPRRGFLSKRKNSRTISYDNYAFDDKQSSVHSGYGRNHQIVPTDRDNVLNPTVPEEVEGNTNFAWID